MALKTKRQKHAQKQHVAIQHASMQKTHFQTPTHPRIQPEIWPHAGQKTAVRRETQSQIGRLTMPLETDQQVELKKLNHLLLERMEMELL
jgi:hypothetical protein